MLSDWRHVWEGRKSMIWGFEVMSSKDVFFRRLDHRLSTSAESKMKPLDLIVDNHNFFGHWERRMIRLAQCSDISVWQWKK
jgi:hypothetical protein